MDRVRLFLTISTGVALIGIVVAVTVSNYSGSSTSQTDQVPKPDNPKTTSLEGSSISVTGMATSSKGNCFIRGEPLTVTFETSNIGPDALGRVSIGPTRHHGTGAPLKKTTWSPPTRSFYGLIGRSWSNQVIGNTSYSVSGTVSETVKDEIRYRFNYRYRTPDTPSTSTGLQELTITECKEPELTCGNTRFVTSYHPPSKQNNYEFRFNTPYSGPITNIGRIDCEVSNPLDGTTSKDNLGVPKYAITKAPTGDTYAIDYPITCSCKNQSTYETSWTTDFIFACSSERGPDGYLKNICVPQFKD